MKTPRIACVIGSAIVASTLHAQPVTDDFESHPVGAFPGGEWHDISDRVVDAPAVTPTMLVVETTDAHGNPTNAVQTNQAPGTNGLYQYVSPETSIHHLRMNVRVDSMHSANAGWPVSMGYSRYLGEGDVNANPQALIYVWTGRVWNLFLALGDGRPALDLRIHGPQLVVGRWYTLTLDVDVQTGVFDARVFDAVTGDLLNSRTHTYPGWDPEVDSFTSITVFDGGDVNSPLQGQSTIDDVYYSTELEPEECAVDLTLDGELDFFDVSAFLTAYAAGDLGVDFIEDGVLDFFDISTFLFLFTKGCP